MQTIETTYFGPTNHRAARLRAKATGGCVQFTPYEVLEGNYEEVHMAAAAKLARKLGWAPVKLIGGHLKKGGLIWVIVSQHSPQIEVNP